MHYEISIKELQTLCNNEKFKWTGHIVTRLQERDINPSDIKNCILTGEVIEQYPNDYPYPSCLIFGYSVKTKPLHVVLGVGEGYLWLISSYVPDINRWEPDLKTRKVLL